MIVLDASVVIGLLDGDDVHHERAEEVFRTSAGRDRGISTVTLAEVLVGPVRAGRGDVVRRALERLRVVEVGLPAGAAVRLAELRATTGLRLPDCCVLLAVPPGGSVASFDQRLLAAAERLGVRRA